MSTVTGRWEQNPIPTQKARRDEGGSVGRTGASAPSYMEVCSDALQTAIPMKQTVAPKSGVDTA